MYSTSNRSLKSCTWSSTLRGFGNYFWRGKTVQKPILSAITTPGGTTRIKNPVSSLKSGKFLSRLASQTRKTVYSLELPNPLNAIQDHSPAVFTRAIRGSFCWQVWSNFRPLCIIQVGWVNLLRFDHPTSLPNFPYFFKFSDTFLGSVFSNN